MVSGAMCLLFLLVYEKLSLVELLFSLFDQVVSDDLWDRVELVLVSYSLGEQE